MKALVFRPYRPADYEELDGFIGIQNVLAGGWPSRIVLDATQHAGVQLWCDDDGISKNLDPNLFAYGPRYRGALVYGAAVLTAFRYRQTPEDGMTEEFVDFTHEQIHEWLPLLLRMPNPAQLARLKAVKP